MGIVRTREEILEELKKIYTGNRFFTKIIVFGSTARGDYKEGSDIDIYYESKFPLSKLCSFKDYKKMKEDVHNIIFDYNEGRSSEYIEIDALILNPSEIKKFKESGIWENIDREGIVLWTNSI